jgi:uncharacterized protein YicC (UPF0701 family)
LLYEDTNPEQVKTLESIEKTVREKVLEHVSRGHFLFFIGTSTGENRGRRHLKSSVGELSLTEGQAQKLYQFFKFQLQIEPQGWTLWLLKKQ